MRQGGGASRRGRILFVATAMVALASAGSAWANTASIKFVDAAGKEDPAAYVGRTLVLTGNAPTANTGVYIKFRAPGGAPCGPSANSDSGDSLSFGNRGYDPAGRFNGNFDVRVSGIWDAPGTFVFCIWMTTGSGSTTSTPITQNITFRGSTGSVSAAVAPPSVPLGQDVAATLSGSTEAPARVYASYRAAGGAPCAGTASADTGSQLNVSGTTVNGSFNIPATIDSPDAGNYQLCVWLARSSSDAPIAGPQPTTFSVVAPPPPPPPVPPCIVPSTAPGTGLSTARSALTTAGCGIGLIRYVASARFARGTIVKLGSTSGTSLAPGAPVSILVSSGKPCIVPKASRGMGLATARARLRRAGCTPGSVRSVRSTRARRSVVRFSPRSGTRRSPRATVTIQLSRGRGR